MLLSGDAVADIPRGKRTEILDSSDLQVSTTGGSKVAAGFPPSHNQSETSSNWVSTMTGPFVTERVVFIHVMFIGTDGNHLAGFGMSSSSVWQLFELWTGNPHSFLEYNCLELRSLEQDPACPIERVDLVGTVPIGRKVRSIR